MSEMELTNPAVIAEGDDEVKILKHRLPTRIMHGAVAVSFCVLAISGIMLLLGFSFGSLYVALIHCIMGLVFIVAPVLWIIFDFGEFSNVIATIFHYDKDDLGWVTAPMGGYLDPFIKRGKEPSYVPPMGKYNTGQKGAGVVLMVCAIVLAITGVVMWGASGSGYFGLLSLDIAPEMVHITWTIHLVAAILILLVFAVHFFLGALYPPTRVEFGTMFGDGMADYAYSVHKHGRWLEDDCVVLETHEKEEASAPKEN